MQSFEGGGVDYDDRLLKAAAGGDREAFATFYRRWLPAITSYYVRRTREREVAFELSCSEAVARQRVHRGLDHMRERLTEIG
jgi:DNA-directed RNA polymerase specialized sigma24 family protein